METQAQRLVLVRERLWALYYSMALMLMLFAAAIGAFAARVFLPGFINGLASGEAVEPGFWLIGGIVGAWLVFATYLICSQTLVLAWNLYGIEILSTDGVHLRVTRRTLGLERTREYRLDEIENLTVAREEHWFDPHLRQHFHIAGGWLRFSYCGQKVRCGKCLNLFSGEEARAQVLAWKQSASASTPRGT